MAYEFRWNDWNIEHIAEHGVRPEEAEEIVQHARRPYPRREGDRKYRVRGRTSGGQWLQVIYIVDPEMAIYVIHARPLTDGEKKQFRRGLK
jgi:uncharacterized DUF497 family protein